MPAEVPIKKKHNILKTILYFLLALFLILTAVGFYLYTQRKPLLTRYVEKTVREKSKGLYHVRFSAIDLNIFSGHVNLKDFELLPDTETYNKFIAIKEAPDNLYRIKIKELDIQSIIATKALFQKKLNIDSVLISKPEVTIINKSQPYNDTVKTEKPKTLYQLIKKIFKQVEIKGINLKNGSFAYVNKNSKPVKQTALNNINIAVKEVLIDSLSEKDASRFYASKNTMLSLNNYKLATPDSLYYLTVKNVYFSSQKRQILFNHIAFTPRYTKAAFYRKVKLSKDRYDLKFNLVSIDHIDLQKLVDQQQLFSSSAKISNAEIEVFNNNAYPEDKSEKLHWDNFPQQKLQKVATAIKIDVLTLKNINVVYAEADRDSKQTGVISFNQISGQIFNITNDSTAKTKNRFATAKLHTRVQNTANLNADFKFDLTDKNGAFSYAGNLGPMDGTLFNKVTVPLGRVKINSVAIQGLTFDADGNNYFSAGKLKLYYKNLNIELEKKDKGEKKLQKRVLISALANTFIVIDNNPDKKGDFRTGLIKYEKPIKAPFFYFLWQSLFTGIKSSAGLSAQMDTTSVNKTNPKKVTVFGKIGSFLGISKEKQEKRRARRQHKKAASQQ